MLKKISLFVLLLLVPFSAYANVMWPGLIIEYRMLAPWLIVSGLLLEELVVLLPVWKYDIKKKLLSVLVMNAVSAVMGIVLVPCISLFLEYFPGFILYTFTEVGMFHPSRWGINYVAIVAFTTLLEWAIVFLIMKTSIPKVICTICNVLSIGIVFLSLYFFPYKDY